jgi:hypothetical protein
MHADVHVYADNEGVQRLWVGLQPFEHVQPHRLDPIFGQAAELFFSEKVRCVIISQSAFDSYTPLTYV